MNILAVLVAGAGILSFFMPAAAHRQPNIPITLRNNNA